MTQNESDAENWNDRPKDERLETISSVVGYTPLDEDGERIEDPEWADYRPDFHVLVRRDWKRKKEERERAEKARKKYEQSKSPEGGPFKCPECGHDAGEYVGDDARRLTAEDFENEETFTTGTLSRQGQGHRRVICPECGHESGRQAFINAWEDEHGPKPKPDVAEEGAAPAPLPGETASGQAKQRRRNARTNSTRR